MSDIILTNQVAPTTPAAGKTAVYVDSTTKRITTIDDAGLISSIREKLTAARTYYVRTDGNDSNTGLANTAGGAFLTIQKAADVASGDIDNSIYGVTIQVGDGTYAAGVICKPLLGSGALTIQGNSGTPSNVHISLSSGYCFKNDTGKLVTIQNMKLTSTSGTCIATYNFSKTDISNIVFGVASNHIYGENYASIALTSNYSIVGGATAHINLSVYSSMVNASRTVTITGSPTITTFILLFNSYINYFAGMTYSGAVTAGTKYYISQNGILNSGGATFPGATGGSTATQGQYL